MNEELIVTIQDLIESNRNLNGTIGELIKDNESLRKQILYLNQAINELASVIKKH